MASDALPESLHGSFELCGAPDNFIGDPTLCEHAVQIMHIDLARETVQDMRRTARAGRGLNFGFGKHIVCSLTLTKTGCQITHIVA